MGRVSINLTDLIAIFLAGFLLGLLTRPVSNQPRKARVIPLFEKVSA